MHNICAIKGVHEYPGQFVVSERWINNKLCLDWMKMRNFLRFFMYMTIDIDVTKSVNTFSFNRNIVISALRKTEMLKHWFYMSISWLYYMFVVYCCWGIMRLFLLIEVVFTINTITIRWSSTTFTWRMTLCTCIFVSMTLPTTEIATSLFPQPSPE